MSIGVQEAQLVSMEQFQELVTGVSPNVTVCVRGRHAVGKSESVYQCAAKLRSDVYKDPVACAEVLKREGGRLRHATGWKDSWSYELGLPVVERRLSQTTEGDLLGLPDRNAIDGESTKFLPCDWIITACKFPVLVFLDERNRALPQVKQCIFQLTDSKVFYNNHFHEESRVVIAENMGDEYQIEALDPAEISRCVTVVLDPNAKEWLNWAKTHCSEALVEFIRLNENHLEFRGQNPEPNKKYPDRRAWVNLDRELVAGKFYSNPESPMIRIMAGAFCGTEVAAKFAQFVRDRSKQVSAEDILKNWGACKARLAVGGRVPNEIFIESLAKIETLIEKLPKEKTAKGFNWTQEMSAELAAFLGDAPGEIFMAGYQTLNKNHEVLKMVHLLVKDILLATVEGHNNTSDEDRQALADKIAAAKEKVAAGALKPAPEAARPETKATRGARSK